MQRESSSEPVLRERPKVFDDQRGRFEVIGHRPAPFRDVYHFLVRSSWLLLIVLIITNFLVVNLIFAFGYYAFGGIANAHPGSFGDVFFFSVQTIGTLGYGEMYPESTAAHVLVVCEVIVGILMMAMATGLVFSKFSVPNARVIFTREAVIMPYDGVPTLMFRIANERANHVVEAQVRVVLGRREISKEGHQLYRLHDLHLVRDRSPLFTRTWSIMHTIDEKSPLYRATPESLRSVDAEVVVTVVGIDSTTAQPVHARHSYLAREIIYGAKHRDILSQLPDNRLRLDLTKFHDVEPTLPTDTFPYSASENGMQNQLSV